MSPCTGRQNVPEGPVSVVLNRVTHRIVEGVRQQCWWEVRCETVGCRNRGAYTIYGPGSEKFFCVACDRPMAVSRLEEL